MARADLIEEGFGHGISPRSPRFLRYRVMGQPPEKLGSAEVAALGIPVRFSPYPFSALTHYCDDVEVEEVIDSTGPNQGFIARATFLPINWSGLRTRFGSSTRTDPIRDSLGIYKLVAGRHFLTGFTTVERRRTQRIITVSAGGTSETDIIYKAELNKGLRYKFPLTRGSGNPPDMFFILDGADTWVDAGNVTFVRTLFSRLSAQPAFPAGSLSGNQDVGYPALDALDEYVVSGSDVGVVTVSVKRGVDIPLGDELTWL